MKGMAVAVSPCVVNALGLVSVVMDKIYPIHKLQIGLNENQKCYLNRL